MKIANKLYWTMCLLLIAAMTGCGGGGSSGSGSGGGGGGGGSSGGSIVTRSFTTWSEVEPNSEYTLTGGISVEASESGDFEDVSRDSSLSFTNDSQRRVTDIEIKTPTSTVSFSRDAGDDIEHVNSLVVALDPDRDKFLVAIDPNELGWDYQTFGNWGQKLSSNNNNEIFGAISAGVPTPGNDIPTKGTATYTGFSSGVYVSDAYVQTFSEVSVDADFGARSLAFATSNTRELVSDNPRNELNLGGTLTYSSGVNSFSGAVNTSSGLSGNADGQFYGPQAEELGGVFATEGGGSFYSGAFGAKR